MSLLFYKKQSAEIQSYEDQTAYYLGYKKSNPPDDNICKMIMDSSVKMQKILNPQLVYEVYDLTVKGEVIQFADLEFESKDLSRNLRNCSKIILFAATIGAQVDALIRRSQLTGSADAAVMQATGAMFVESFVDAFNDEIKQKYEQEGAKLHPRFSPGFGDVSIQLQKDFFRLLACNKIGLSLMDTLIMAPEKSVTAFIGIEV